MKPAIDEAHCGLCGGYKKKVEYNAARPPAQLIQQAWICKRCDLTPDPAVRP